MTAPAAWTWVTRSTIEPSSDAEALDWLDTIRRTDQAPQFSIQAYVAQVDGTLGDNVSQFLVRGPDATVVWDCTQPTPGGLRLGMSAERDLIWGNDILAIYQLQRSREANAILGLPLDSWMRFAVNHFVITQPGLDDLDMADVRQLVGYDKNYLLQNQPGDSFAFDAGSLYKEAVEAVFVAAKVASVHLSEVCDFPGEWATKTLPADQPMNYPMDDNLRFLDIVNDLLKASGCRPVYTQPNGRWLIELIPKPATQTLRWRWSGSRTEGVTESDLDAKVSMRHSNRYAGDVWNVPNRWIFIQDGLNFEPVEGSGQYTVDNLDQPPSGRSYVGRIVRSVQYLQASGQDDLVKQGDEIVQAQLAQAEQIDLTTAPWPIAGHFDVFQYRHVALPLQPRRRLQAQSWVLDLWGAPMTWRTYAVSQS